MAVFAELYVEPQLVEGIGKAECIFFAFFYEVQYEAQGCFFTNAWEFGNLVYGIFNKFRRKFQSCLLLAVMLRHLQGVCRRLQ